MPFIKRHRSGEEMPRLTHPQPDERAAPLCQDLVKHPAVQAAILGGSRHTGGWDDQSDLDIVVILEESDEEEETKRAASDALAVLKDKHYPGYRDRGNPDREVRHGQWIVTMEYFLAHRRTVNHPMAQAAHQGRIFTRELGAEAGYRHDGDTSNEWDLVTVEKLRRATNQYKQIPAVKKFFDGEPLSGIEVRTSQGRTAYWLIWCSGSAIMSVLGIGYRNRSLVDMAESLKINDPGWIHRFASDLDCLDQYNGCGCEVVVARPIPDLEAMWEALERDREALWRRIRELTGIDLGSASVGDMLRNGRSL